MHKSAKKLPGAFFSQSCTSLLYQASTTELPVRYAIQALGSAHREEAPEYGKRQEYITLRQYNKAIRCLRSCTPEPMTMSLTISLFVNMEYLRGHYGSALIHLESGWKLFRRSISLKMDGFLLTSFTRLLVQAKLAGQLMHLRVPTELLQAPSYDAFRSPDHARRELEHIILRTYNREDRKPLESALVHWHEVHKRMPLSTLDMSSFAYRLLKLYYYVATIIVGTYSEDEMAFDSFNRTFLEIVHHSIDIYTMLQPGGTFHHPNPSSLKSVSDIGWIAPLYITATKCRIPRLRHQSIQLLETVPHKEGIFDSRLATIIAREICNIEGQTEWESFDTLEAPSTEVLSDTALPLWSRISNHRVDLPADANGTLILRYRHHCHELCRQYNLESKTWTYESNLSPVDSSLIRHNFSAAA